MTPFVGRCGEGTLITKTEKIFLLDWRTKFYETGHVRIWYSIKGKYLIRRQETVEHWWWWIQCKKWWHPHVAWCWKRWRIWLLSCHRHVYANGRPSGTSVLRYNSVKPNKRKKFQFCHVMQSDPVADVSKDITVKNSKSSNDQLRHHRQYDVFKTFFMISPPLLLLLLKQIPRVVTLQLKLLQLLLIIGLAKVLQTFLIVVSIPKSFIDNIIQTLRPSQKWYFRNDAKLKETVKNEMTEHRNR